MKRVLLLASILSFCLFSQAQSHLHITLNICAGELPYTWQGTSYNTGGNHISSSGDTLTLIVHQASHTHHNSVVCQGNSFTDYGFYFSEEETATPCIIHDTIHFQTIWGCDSSISLTLTVQPLPNVHVSNDTVIFGNQANLTLQISGADYYVWEQTGGSRRPLRTMPRRMSPLPNPLGM